MYKLIRKQRKSHTNGIEKDEGWATYYEKLAMPIDSEDLDKSFM